MSARAYRVLGVDDNEDDLLLLRIALRQTPHLNLAATVHNGAEAISYLKGEGRFADRHEYPLPDVMVLDIKMPQLDGFGVLEWLRQQARKSCRVIVLTSSLDESDKRRAIEMGAESFCIKPVDPAGYKGVARALEQLASGSSQ
jgi:CheY-like chemotaxis protein